MSDQVRCPGSGQRTARFGFDDPDRCPVCDRIAYVRVDGTTGAHTPTRWWLRHRAPSAPNPPTREE